MLKTASRSAKSLPEIGVKPSRACGSFPARRSVSCRTAAPAAGSVFRNRDLARSLRAIAAGGRDGFYKGPIAEAIVQYSGIGGRALLRSRISPNTRARSSIPSTTNYRGYDIWELPPNGQGIAALQMLNLLEAYDLKAWDRNRPQRFT